MSVGGAIAKPQRRRRRARVIVGLVCVALALAVFAQLAYYVEDVPTVASSPPALQRLPSYCTPPSVVDALVQATYPGAKFEPSYEMGPGWCTPAPTLVLPDGEQVAVVIQNGEISSTSVLKSGSSFSLDAGFSRWSGYEAYAPNTIPLPGLTLPLQNEQVLVASADRSIPDIQVPSNISQENASAQALCCAFSEWVGQVDTPGGETDLKLIQIGIDQAVGPLSDALGVEYVGFYEALPGDAIYFNSTQVPCGMPSVGEDYNSSVTNLGAYNVTNWEYALTFANDSCGGARYVVYEQYPMSGLYAEVQSEAPAACIAGVVEKQEQLPQFSEDQTLSTALSFNRIGSAQTLTLAQTSATNYVIVLGNATYDTFNTGVNASGGGFSTYWVASGLSGLTQFC